MHAIYPLTGRKESPTHSSYHRILYIGTCTTQEDVFQRTMHYLTYFIRRLSLPSVLIHSSILAFLGFCSSAFLAWRDVIEEKRD
jgi:hypothetical protein